jgi:hypothetical protein
MVPQVNINKMGNSSIVMAFKGASNFIPISSKNVTFFEGRFTA